MQLEWGKDDREGRFLLKREDDKTALVSINTMFRPSLAYRYFLFGRQLIIDVDKPQDAGQHSSENRI